MMLNNIKNIVYLQCELNTTNRFFENIRYSTFLLNVLEIYINFIYLLTCYVEFTYVECEAMFTLLEA
jgi:hypothetical protein